MSPTLFQYLFESTCSLMLFWGVYYLIGRQWLSVLGRRYFLLLTPLLALILPLWDISNLVTNYNLAEGHFGEGWTNNLPYLKISPLTVISVLYFAGVCWQGFSMIDRFQSTWSRLRMGYAATAWQGFRYRNFPFLAALFHYHFEDSTLALKPGPQLQLWFRQIRAWHVAEVILLEIGLALFWFQPFLYFFRSELHHQNRLLLEESAQAVTPQPPSLVRWGTLVFSSFGVLFFLFSANQFCRFPLGSELETWSLNLQTRLEQPLFTLGQPVQQTASYSWGTQHIPLFPEKLETAYRYRPTQLTSFEFSLARDKDWLLQIGRKKKEAVAFEAVVVAKNGQRDRFGSAEDLRSFLLQTEGYSEFTIYFKIVDANDQTWLGLVGITDSGRAYGTAELEALSDQIDLIHWQRFSKSPWYLDVRPSSPYRIVWGPIQKELKQYANPDLYNGFAELTVEEAKDLVEAPIQFYFQDSLLAIEDLNFYRVGKRWDRVAYEIDLLDSTARVASGQDFLAHLQPGNEFQIYARLPGVVLNQFFLRIVDPKGDYLPLVSIPQPRLPDTTFSFQLIDRKELSSVLKIDTTHNPTRSVYDLYKTYPRYQIQHIPDFKTYRRLVSYDEGGLTLIGNSDLPPAAFFPGDGLPEFLDYPGRKIQLRWGELFAAPDSEVYGRDEWENAVAEKPYLQVDNERFELLHAVVFIVSDLEAESVVLLNEQVLRNWEAPTALREMASHRTLFLQELVVESPEGEKLVFPQSFALHIGKPASHFSWEVTWEEIPSGGQPVRAQDSLSISFSNYPLTQLIADLSDRKLNRIEFDGLPKEITLNISLTAPDSLPSRSQEYLLRFLKKKYRFVFDQGRMDIPNRRLQVLKPDLLDAVRYESEMPPLEKVRILNQGSSHLLTGVTLDELALHLEDHFGIPFDWYPHGYQQNQYIFSLDLSSLEILSRQMEKDYGVSVSEADWIWNGLRVLFMD
jgi:hypothetical protein